MTSRSLSRILTGLLVFPLACSSGGSSGGATGGSNGTGTGGSNSTGTGGTNSTGTGGSSATGTGGSNATGSGGSNATGTGGRATGTGGGVITGSGGSAGSHGSGGSASGGTTGGGGSATTGSGGSGTGTGGSTADQNVLERNKNPSRDGLFVQPTLTKAMAMAMAPDTNFNNAATFTSTATNGTKVAASPVYLDDANGGLFFITTAGGDVVALKADGTSQWKTSMGTPATGGIGCSSFATQPPLGILSTPAIDAASKTIYVAGIVGNAQGVTSQVATAIDITTGKVKSGWPVDVGMAASFDPKLHNQRSALSLLNGSLYIAYAGYVGDCGDYHGRVVALNASTGALAGQWISGDMQGDGIWASGGLASDGTSIFAATGNQTPLNGTFSAHTDSEEVVRITATGTKADFFTPSDWSNYDGTDADLGSTNPMVITVPGATPSKLVVIIAKGGKGYLLDAGKLGGMNTGGGQLATFSLSNALKVFGAPASYRTATGTYVVMTSAQATGCPGGGTGGQVMGVRISASPLAASVVWCASNASSTNPIATTTDGTSDAIVWYSSGGKLMGVDGDTGATVYSSTNSCSGVPQWSSPIAVKGRIVVAGTGHLCAWGIPGALSQAAQPAKAKRHKRVIASSSHTRG